MVCVGSTELATDKKGNKMNYDKLIRAELNIEQVVALVQALLSNTSLDKLQIDYILTILEIIEEKAAEVGNALKSVA